MATYRPGDEINDIIEFPIFNVTTGANAMADFSAYAADADLDTIADGEVLVFGSTDPALTGSYITVDVAGVATVLDGTGVYAKRHPTNDKKAYFTYNAPATPDTYYFKYVYSLTDGDDQKSIFLQHTVANVQ